METSLPRKSYLGPTVLAVAGVLLLGFLLVCQVADVPRGLWVTSLSLSPWGPICLIVAFLVARHVRKVNRLVDHGIAARATVESIDSTSSSINGRQVLRIGMSVTVDELPEYPVTVRNAPPYHLVGMLRPGASIPVVVDPDTPEQVLIDWKRAEREPSGPGL
ncbi:hypothetical protein JOF56_005758 [Kibdelosporangium banguiense]|uniref:DUF3093 domain-containing protein n=1 Tax=Kibdelosporangium banguiense TaxID=1365924 RepID=A0ABS4TN77_9PSEU|nr:DUF3592 domain-containing protein [Kibdelosporangium banguiense]MBP2325373.1 hypothetical protein [Kibdelosporangium banguiense]